MHTIKHDKSRMHFNSDFSGEVVVSDGKNTIEIPGELVQKVVEYCVDGFVEKYKNHILALPLWPWGKSVYAKEQTDS